MLFPCWRLPFPILFCFTIAYCATTPGTIALFFEEACPQVSVDSPTSELQVNGCAVTPTCSSGEMTLIGHQDTSCTNSIDDNNITQHNNCCSTVLDGFCAVKLLCDSAAGGSAPTATQPLTRPPPLLLFQFLEPRDPFPQTPPAAAAAMAQAPD